jgi:protein required for attachment to host cells
MPRKDPEARKAYQREYAAKRKAYARVKAWREANPDKVAEQNKRYAEKHPEQLRAKALRSKYKNLEKVRERDRSSAKKYRQSNKDKVALSKKRYAQENKGKINAAVAKREAAKILRTPKWLTEDDLWMIEEAYSLAALRAKMFGISWHVDHVIPLQGKNVSGLHVPINLQVIPGVENIRKGNRMVNHA